MPLFNSAKFFFSCLFIECGGLDLRIVRPSVRTRHKTCELGTTHTTSTAERKNKVSWRGDEERRISVRGWRTTYLGARMKNDVSRGEDEEWRISTRGWRTTYLDARMKNVVSRDENEEQRIPALLHTAFGQYTVKYVALHRSAEIRRSSFSRRHTSLFDLAPRYIVLHIQVEVRNS